MPSCRMFPWLRTSGITAIALLASLVLADPAGAVNGWSGYGQLSPKQQRLLQEIYADYAGRLYALTAEIAARQAELEARLAAPSVEAEAIEDVVEELNHLRSELLAERVQMIVDMRSQGLPFFGLGRGLDRRHGILGQGFSY